MYYIQQDVAGHSRQWGRAVEGLNQINTGEILSLSEQQLDCNPEGYGCRGGSIPKAFEYIQQSSEGIMTEDDYSYQAYKGQCQATASPQTVTINGYENVPQYDENALMQAVSQQPVSVGIDVTVMSSFTTMAEYLMGIVAKRWIMLLLLLGMVLIQMGLIIGYWRIHGENGFMRIIRGQNQCGLTV